MDHESNSAATAAELDELIRVLRDQDILCDQAADALAALRRERDEAQRDSRALERTHQAIPLEFCLDPPDGGDVKPWEAAERMAKALSEARAANAQMAAALRDLLADIDERAAAYRHSPSENIRRHYANVPLSDGVLSRARDALPPLGEDAIMREALMRSVKVDGDETAGLRDAVIEECAKIADEFVDLPISSCPSDNARAIAENLRALAAKGGDHEN